MSLEHLSVLPTEQIKNTLACLDLSLESELALYRRQLSQTSSALALATLPQVEEETDLEEAITSETTPLSQLEAEVIETAQEPETAPQDPEVRTLSALVSFSEPAIEEDEPEALPESYNAELTAEPEAFERFLDPSIEDYLESSEALLKHLDDPQEKVKAQAKPKSKSSWPLLLRVAIGLVGVIALAWFIMTLIAQWLTPKPHKKDSAPQSLLQPAQSFTPPGQGIGADTLRAQPTNSLISSAASAQTASPKPTVTKPNPSKDGKADYYLVVTGYTGDASLQEARQLVPDAFLADFEGQRRIQLGLLEELPQARQLVNELKNQGFSSSIVAQR